MTNWKKFTIIENNGHSEVTRIKFNKKVYQCIDYLSFFNRHPFNSLLPGDEVEIDIDKAIEFKESVNRWYKETNLGGYTFILKERIDDESIIRTIRCKFQENMALVSRNANELSMVQREKETEITSLREELENSQSIDLRYRERKLDELARNLGLNRERIDNLRSAYERLKRASDPENYNQESITNAQNEIDNIKRELFQTNINVDDLHKVYKVCEKVAELRIKQEKIRQQQQQQYQAHQEQPTNN